MAGFLVTFPCLPHILMVLLTHPLMNLSTALTRFTALTALLVSSHSLHAQVDGSVGYWAGNRGEALTLAKRAAADAPPPPKGEFDRPSSKWGKEPVVALTDKRGRVTLRGGWNAATARNPNWSMISRQEPVTNRTYVRETPPWHVAYALWYGRTIHIPSEWAGRRIAVDFEQINRTGLVIVNDQPCGVVDLAGSVDITDAVKPGEDAKLIIYMVEAPPHMPLAGFGGLVSDVHLISYPAGPRVTDVYVKPSTRKGEVALEVDLSFVEKDGPVEIIAEMASPDGNVEKRFTGTLNAKSAPLQTLEITWPWKDARLWDIGKPEMYHLRLAVKGAGIDDNYHQEFGFREFWIDGRKIFLNNTEVFLRSGHANWLGLAGGGFNGEGIEGTEGHDFRAYFDFVEKAGFNYLHQTPGTAWPNAQWEIAQLASRRGVLMAGHLPSGRSVKLDDPAAVANYQEATRFVAKRLRNLPAIVTWVSSGIPSMPGQDQNPYMLGKPEELAGKNPPLWEVQKKASGGDKPLYWHAFTHGDVMSVNWYLCFTPTQEREDWITNWLKEGKTPVHGSEFGMPFNYQFMRMRTHQHNSGNPLMHEPFIVEHAASLFGPQMYYEMQELDWHLPGWGWNDTGIEPVGGVKPNSFLGVGMFLHNGWIEKESKLIQRYLAEYPGPTWKSWRTYGFNLMPVAWWGEFYRGARLRDGWRPKTDDQFLPQEVEYIKANQPTLAWLAGPKDAFTRKDHSFWENRSMPEKSLVLINDTRDPQPYDFTWSVMVGGKEVARERVTGTLNISERKFLPITANLPQVEIKTDGSLIASGTIGSVEHQDQFAFRVFPSPAMAAADVLLWDPSGKTKSMLEALGCKTAAWDGKSSDRLLVIGRDALRGEAQTPGDLKNFVAEGGRLMVMAHHPEWVEDQLGMRVSKFMSRRVFPTNDHHPVGAGLDDMDLRDWGGESTLVDSHPREYRDQGDYGMPRYGWRWGNRGGISSGAPEAPHQAGWKSIMVSEFDLAYAPAMELDFGKGRVIWCSVDLEDYVPSEPAAVALALQLVKYATTSALSPRLPTYLVGLDNSQRETFERMGIIATMSRDLPQPPALAIIGGRSRVTDEEMKAFAENGGTLFFLSTDDYGDTLGVKFKPVKEIQDNKFWRHIYPEIYKVEGEIWPTIHAKRGRDIPVPDWPELAGLGVADFHRRGEMNYLALDSGCETAMHGFVGRKQVGKGRAIYCQIDPESIKVAEKPFMRPTRWRQTRVLTQMLANAGAQFKLDEGLLVRRSARDIAPEVTGGYYHPDYSDDMHFGDNPFRYWRW